MSCWVVIPVKPPGQGKSRLAGALTGDARNRLVHAMLDRVVAAASGADYVDRVCILGASRHGHPTEILRLDDSGDGLNAALMQALAQASAAGASKVVFIAADLPGISANDVDMLVAATADTIAIASDRHGVGTNAIGLPLPLGKDFTFAYGADSLAAHCIEARRIGLDIALVASPGLARDIDVPEDLSDVGGMWPD